MAKLSMGEPQWGGKESIKKEGGYSKGHLNPVRLGYWAARGGGAPITEGPEESLAASKE